jgi:hypothetical protein
MSLLQVRNFKIAWNGNGGEVRNTGPGGTVVYLRADGHAGAPRGRGLPPGPERLTRPPPPPGRAPMCADRP